MQPLTAEQFHYVLNEAGWPVELWQEATDVAFCESTLRPGAQNGVHLGLFQVNFYYDAGGNPEIFSGWDRWVEENYGVSGDPFDPIYNAWVAWLIYERNNGWSWNWPHCGAN